MTNATDTADLWKQLHRLVRSTLPPTCIRVFVMIAAGNAHKLNSMAAELGLGFRSVQTAVRKLADAGYIFHPYGSPIRCARVLPPPDDRVQSGDKAIDADPPRSISCT